MKNAKFKMVYTTETIFDGSDMVQLFDNDHVTIVDRSQRDAIQPDDETRNLIEIFNEDGYELTYHGLDAGAVHAFKISNGLHTIELQMGNAAFQTNFTVE